MNEKCSYSDECGIEKLYLDAIKENQEHKNLEERLLDSVQQLKDENKLLNSEIRKIKEQYKDLQECHRTNAESFMQWMLGDFAVQKLEKIRDRVQDVKCDDEHNIEVMNDILRIIEEKE